MKLILTGGQSIQVKEGLNGFEVTNIITPGLAKKALFYKLDGQFCDMSSIVKKEGLFEIITEEDPLALGYLRHDASHLLAQALMQLFPGIQFGIGPSIEDGFYYDVDLDRPLSEEDFPAIEAKMRSLSKENHKLVRQEVSKEEALVLFKENPYKVELIKELEGIISVYVQGAFMDLCMGPHLPSTSYVQHFKLLSVAGAYWRGDSNKKQLQRIYGTAFFSKAALEEHLALIEERKKRDHRKLGKELGLFMISDYGPGFPFWLDKGLTLRKTLENYWYKVHRQEGYTFVTTPIMLSKELWEISGHWFNYRANMYTSKIDEKEFAIKPMNCPGGMLVYKNSLHSYKDLPIRMGELGLVHRHEASGALSGLFRVRNFTQDDAHIYCRPDQLIDEVVKLLALFDRFYSLFGLKYHIELSTRPTEKFIGTIEVWDKSEKALAEACQKIGKPFKLNPGDGAFYGPKLDFKLRDSMNRVWQCGTIQLDMNLPERFDLTYINEHNEKVRPIMLHRAIYGSLERFIGILIEHFGGAFPTWLAPVQAIILPVNNSVHTEYTAKVRLALEAMDVRVEIDNSEEKLGYRLRSAQMNKIPYSLVIGDSEMKNNEITYRIYGQTEQITVSLSDFVTKIVNDIKTQSLTR